MLWDTFRQQSIKRHKQIIVQKQRVIERAAAIKAKLKDQMKHKNRMRDAEMKAKKQAVLDNETEYFFLFFLQF